MKREILGLSFDSLSLEEAAARALELMGEKKGAYVCTPNPEIVMRCRREPALCRAVKGADMVLPDGVGVVWAARRLRMPLKERVTGVDLCQALLGAMEGRLFLLGGREGVAERAAENIQKQYPGLTVCGTQHGYFEDEEAVRARIRQLRPDFLAVCLGSPRQELFMESLAGCEQIGLMAGLGGTLDVLAGDIPRAPEFFIRHGLEWLYRLWRQPRRIKRMLCLPRFVVLTEAQRIKNGKR